MNLNSVDLNLLVVFEALLDERNVTRAAERVARAQPSVSNALNRLRYLFKDELFIRTPNGMIPTSKALELEQPIREALNGVRIALATHDEFDPQQCEGTIHLATSDTVDDALQIIVRRVRDAMGTQVCSVYLREAASGAEDEGDLRREELVGGTA